jgi:Ca2+-binding RTX toxin-like protein
MGRRVILLLSAMATMVVVSAGVALAVAVIGTVNADTCSALVPPASNFADEIALAGGNDTCNGLNDADQISGDSGDDMLSGGNGNDQISGDSGDDMLSGGNGNDEIYGDSGEDEITGGIGADDLYGGGGTNVVNGAAGAGDFVSVVDGDTDDSAEGGPQGGDICAVDDPTEADPTCETVLHARP